MRQHLNTSWRRSAGTARVEAMERRLLFSAGDLDRSFGGDGMVLTDFGGLDQAAAAVLLPGGKMLVAGGGTGESNFALARYLPDGTLDPTFGGGDGRATGDFAVGDRLWARANDVAVLPDGRIVLVGSLTEDDSGGGELTAGRVTPQLGGVWDYFAVARFNADGSVDTTFGDAGHVITRFAGEDVAESVAVQADGKYVVAGWSAGRLAVVRYDPGGALDRSFGSGGHVIEPDGSAGMDVAVVGNKILVAGSYDADFAVLRYNADGTRDASFGGGDGVATVSFGAEAGGHGSRAEALAIQGDGRLVVAGAVATNRSPDSEDLGLARFNRDGTIDTSFGRGGTDGDGAVSLNPAGAAIATGVGFAPNGQILVSVGTRNYAGDVFGAARFTADGSLDPTYGRGGVDGDGIASVDFTPAGGANGESLVVLPDGRAVVAGGAGGNFAVARLAADAAGPDGDGNDQLFEAKRVAVGGTWSQSTAGRTDVDTYSFAASTGQRIGFDVDTPAGSGLDAFVRVFAPDGTELIRNDNGAAPGEAAGVSPYAEFTFSASGTYFVSVSWAGNRAYDPVAGTGDAMSGSRASATGAFTLTLTDRTPRPPADADDQLSEALSTSVGATVVGKSLTSFDVDTYQFVARAGQRVGFDTSGASGDRPDTYLRLFTPAGVELAANDNGAAPGEAAADGGSYVEYTFSAPGRYYASVSGAPNTAYDPVGGTRDVAGATGRYTLRLIDRPAGPAAPPAPPPAATIDTTFAGGGTTVTPLGYGSAATAVAVQSDGTLVVAGPVLSNNQADFAVARYLPNGTLDPSFAVRTDFGGYPDVPYAVTALQGGKLLVVGSARPAAFDDSDFGIARYNPDGTLDASFGGGDGRVTTSFGSAIDEARAVAVLPGGKFLVAGRGGQGAGENWTGMVLARYNPDGTLDPTFGGDDGFVITFPPNTSGGATSMAIAPDGKIVLGGPVIARYNADGTPDSKFGDHGIAYAWGGGDDVDVAVQADGKIVVTYASEGTDTVLVLSRLDTAGHLDTTFGIDPRGVTTVPLGRGPAADVATALLPNGQILVAGQGRSTVNTTSNLSDAFSPANPSAAPNGKYAFGYKSSPTGTFARFDAYRADATYRQYVSHAVAGASGGPSVSKNLGAEPVPVGEDYEVGPGQVGLTSGPDGAREYAVVRFTASRAGEYLVQAVFRNRNRASQGADAAVVAGGQVRWSAQMPNVPDEAIFSDGITLAAGESVDFVVGNGADGAGSDFVSLDLTVEYAPAPDLDVALVRFTRDGLLDPMFDGTASKPGDGVVFTDLGAVDRASAIALQTDGKIVVAGTVQPSLNDPAGRGFALARYLGNARGPDGDPDDQISEATPLRVGGAAAADALAGAADVNMYELAVTEGHRVGFDVTSARLAGANLLLRLFNAAGAELALNDDGAAPGEVGSRDPYLEYTFSAAGTYYVAVSASANRSYNPIAGTGDAAGVGGGGSYTLSLTDTTPEQPSDPDDQLTTARPTAIGTDAGGKIDRATDVDILSFTAATGQRAAFDVVTLSGALRPHLRLLADDGTELAAGTAGGTVNGSSLEFTFSAAGTYYVAVSSRPNVAYDPLTGGNDAGAGGATGTYRLRTRDFTPGSQLLQAEDAAVRGAAVRSDNSGYTGTGYVDFVNTAGDYVEWSLTVPGSGAYTLQFRYANGGSKDRPLELRVNGQVLPPLVPFQPTGGWSVWETVAVPVNLDAGVNTIRLTATGRSGPNIDLLNAVPAT